jgi:hypothetical protein
MQRKYKSDVIADLVKDVDAYIKLNLGTEEAHDCQKALKTDKRNAGREWRRFLRKGHRCYFDGLVTHSFFWVSWSKGGRAKSRETHFAESASPLCFL